MTTTGSLSAIGLITVLAAFTVGAKCPLPPPEGGDAGQGHHDAGAHGGSGGGGNGGAAHSGGSTGTACHAPSPLDVWTSEDRTQSIRGLFAIAPNDVWLSMDSSVQHWDGTAWTNVPEPLDPAVDNFGPVWASGPHDVWLSGEHLIRWNGSSWTNNDAPGMTNPNVIGRGPNDVWAWSGLSVAHWDGTSWTLRPPAPDTSARSITAMVMWPAAGDDVWLAGLSFSGPVLEHWTAGGWTLVPTPQPVPHIFTGMWGSSPADIWLLGDRGMYHYDGVSWTLADGTLKGAGAVWGSCATDVWASLTLVSAAGFGQLAHFDGTKWSKVAPAPGAPSFISGTGPDDVWAAGYTRVTISHMHQGDPAPVCGNVRLDPGEQCDPPDGLTCGANCQRVAGCGDGVVQSGEMCDPPDGLTCGSTCQLIPTCGNTFVDLGEQCDPPNQTRNTPWCDSNCQIPRCGNGVVDPGEGCDPPQLGGWTPGTGSSLYCGTDCAVHDACAECHQLCDTDPLGFATCAQRSCSRGIYLPCK